MTWLIVRRLLQLPIILLVVYTITFALAWLIPGNPLENPEGRRPPPEIAEAMRAQYRLDDPWRFYWDYLGKASGASWLLGRHDRPFDLGPSLKHENWTVNEILAAGLPVSVSLGLLAMLLACAIGLTAGVVGGVRPGSTLDLATLMVALVGISLPTFVTGTLLLIALSVRLELFPVAGWGGLGHAVLPALTLALPFAAYIARLTRFGMIEQLGSDYVRTARAKGVPEHRVVLRHALKNAFLPVLSYLGPAAAAAMTGSFVVEKVFAVPGIGTHLLVLFNLTVDVLYRWADPRIA
jgi:oligopeptide transport system permease protein